LCLFFLFVFALGDYATGHISIDYLLLWYHNEAQVVVVMVVEAGEGIERK
jgi:hypothetical protein